MARKGRYTKKPKLGPGCQQPLTAPPLGSGSHQADSQVLPAGGDGIPPTSHPFRPPRNEPRPTIQMSANSVHNSELGQETLLEGNAPEVESRDHEVDDHFSSSEAQSCKRRKTTEFWTPARLSVREAMERPNGRRIVLRFNNEMHPIGDEAGLLSGVLGLLGSDYLKFPIERIEEIEQHDESSRVLSQNDSIAQVFGKEKPGRVRGVGFGLTPTQLFGSNSHVPGNRVEEEETQRKLFALHAELEGEKLKRKAMEDEAAADKKKMQAMERALIYLFQRQGEELPRDITVEMSSVE
ncbi:hypothetical protein Ahy_B08g090181 [Arachis hypogaea]|uniref:Uncharacterized protein n=1 Tax=Arachis hypogaea TaxID=3818 RepID=A0A444XZM5_ARAHY|nr:hypothetical protein Ahy_B08g090181 [Arachis hypogaea]